MLWKLRGDIAGLLSPGDIDPFSRWAIVRSTRDATSPESVVGQGAESPALPGRVLRWQRLGDPA